MTLDPTYKLNNVEAHELPHPITSHDTSRMGHQCAIFLNLLRHPEKIGTTREGEVLHAPDSPYEVLGLGLSLGLLGALRGALPTYEMGVMQAPEEAEAIMIMFDAPADGMPRLPDGTPPRVAFGGSLMDLILPLLANEVRTGLTPEVEARLSALEGAPVPEAQAERLALVTAEYRWARAWMAEHHSFLASVETIREQVSEVAAELLVRISAVAHADAKGDAPSN